MTRLNSASLCLIGRSSARTDLLCVVFWMDKRVEGRLEVRLGRRSQDLVLFRATICQAPFITTSITNQTYK